MTLDDDVTDDVLVRMITWGYCNPCTDPEHHQFCRDADIVLAGYDVWRRTPRLTDAQHEEMYYAFFTATQGLVGCIYPQSHIHCVGVDAVFAGYAEAE